MEARKPVSLFPVESPFGAIIAEYDPTGKITFSAKNTVKFVSKNPKLANEDPGVLLEARGDRAMVHPKGYSFCRALEGDQIMLVNFLLRGNQANVTSLVVDPIIDPSMIAVLDENEEDITLCGVSNNGKRILGYTIAEPKRVGTGIRSIVTNNGDNGRLGFEVYALKAEDTRTITNIVSCPHHSSPETSRNFVIGFSNGEVELFTVDEKKLLSDKKKVKLVSANEELVGMSLLLSDNGRLIACSTKSNKMQMWDLSNADVAQSHAVANAGALSMSLDGAYLVARDNSKPGEEAVQVYVMPSHDSTKFKHSSLLTKKLMECAVLGPEGSLLTAHRNVEGKLEVHNEGNLLALLQGKIEAVNLHPTPERVSREHKTAGFGTPSIFSKLTLKRKGEKSKPKTAAKEAAEAKAVEHKVDDKQTDVPPVTVADDSVVVTSVKQADGVNTTEVSAAGVVSQDSVKEMDKQEAKADDKLEVPPPAMVPPVVEDKKPQAASEKKRSLFTFGRFKSKPAAVTATTVTAAPSAAQPEGGNNNNASPPPKDGEMTQLRISK